MDQLENQVSDLRSFLAPVPASSTTGAPLQHPPPHVSPAAAAITSPVYHGNSPGGPLLLSSTHTISSAPGDNSALQQQQHQQQQQQQRQQQRRRTSPLSPLESSHNGSNNATSSKRRAEEDDGEGYAKQQRNKRNRYISIACNECKRRKIKCNGETPCQRCGHLNLQCLYAPNCCANFKDSDEFKKMTSQVSRLQEQVDTLFSAMTALRQETSLRLAPIQDRILPPPSATVTPSPSTASLPPLARPHPAYRVPPSFHGPTSIAFTVDVAKNTLHRMGYTGPGMGDGNEEGTSQPEPTPHASPMLAPLALPSTETPRDPLWGFEEAEMLRLCHLYEEEVGAMYPVVKIEPVVHHAKSIGAWMAMVKRTGQSPGATDLNDNKTLVLKMVLCCALAVDEHGNSAKAVQLYGIVQPLADRMLMSEPADVEKLPFLALIAGYRYLSNDEILAWRVVGHVARLCMELGLHRKEGLQKIKDPKVQRDAVLTFWSMYVLDRRWSFSTGLPFVCHDDKIDPTLPQPDEYPFLVAMIGYSKLGAKIWGLVDCFEPAVIRELKAHNFENLEREIWEWYQTVPQEIKTDPADDRIDMPASPADTLQRVRIWTRLRLNQIRIWLYTPVLHSATSIVENMQLADRAVELAKKTIRLLAHINGTTDLYRRCQVFYHQFLTSSIAVLFLASTHAPVEFSAKCRTEFYMALDLVRDLSAKSWVSHRLWRTIRSLKAVAPKLGLEEDVSQAANRGGQPSTGMGFSSTHMHLGSTSDTTHSPRPGPLSFSREASRAPTHRSPSVSTPVAQHQQVPLQQLTDDQSNGLRLQTEMSRIYEGYMGMNVNGVSRSMENGIPGVATDMTFSRGGLGGLAGLVDEVQGQGDESVYQHMKDMF
ncbi:putative fungal-specific transcription factor [Podospora australis]|uniref:Fungal-specific transcription factor n=1 Tax=Podospora australis TaxID=1536484 RepID=A0AAN6WS36_9PEZI|nr:putative fungal-specific transcription factor [Podospora australis]